MLHVSRPADDLPLIKP